MNLSNSFYVRPIFLNKRYDSFAVVFGDIFCFIFYLLYWLYFWGAYFYGFNFYFRGVSIRFDLLTLSGLLRFFLTNIHIILFLRKARIFANNPIVMVSWVGNLFWSWIDELIHQAEALFCWSMTSLELKNRFNLDRFLFKFKVFEYTFEDIGRAIIGPNVRPKWWVFEVGKKTITFNEAHKSNSIK